MKLEGKKITTLEIDKKHLQKILDQMVDLDSKVLLANYLGMRMTLFVRGMNLSLIDRQYNNEKCGSMLVHRVDDLVLPGINLTDKELQQVLMQLDGELNQTLITNLAGNRISLYKRGADLDMLDMQYGQGYCDRTLTRMNKEGLVVYPVK